MNIKVYYVSPKGCAQSVAMAIAKEYRSAQEPLMPAYPPENVALMFIGCEGKKADKVTKEFLESLNTNRVRNAAVFACSPKQDESALTEMREVLENKGINVVGSMAFPGKGFLSGRNPGKEDLDAAAKFAQECVGKV